MRRLLKRLFHVEPSGVSGTEVTELRKTTRDLKQIADDLRDTHHKMRATIVLLEDEYNTQKVRKTPKKAPKGKK